MKLTGIVVVLIVGLSVAASTQAGQGKKATKPEGVVGVITSVDEAGRSFTFHTGKKKDPDAKDVTVQFNDATKFFKMDQDGKSEAKSTDLGAKKRVAVVINTTEDGKSVASKVTILEVPKKKK